MSEKISTKERLYDIRDMVAKETEFKDVDIETESGALEVFWERNENNIAREYIVCLWCFRKFRLSRCQYPFPYTPSKDSITNTPLCAISLARLSGRIVSSLTILLLSYYSSFQISRAKAQSNISETEHARFQGFARPREARGNLAPTIFLKLSSLP
jgi:hypothetical protein